MIMNHTKSDYTVYHIKLLIFLLYCVMIRKDIYVIAFFQSFRVDHNKKPFSLNLNYK
jgi:hypothetical protein